MALLHLRMWANGPDLYKLQAAEVKKTKKNNRLVHSAFGPNLAPLARAGQEILLWQDEEAQEDFEDAKWFSGCFTEVSYF